MSLLADLDRLGDQLISADLPQDPRKVLGALVHYVESGGSLEAPSYTTPEQERSAHEERSEIDRLRAQVAELQAAQGAETSPPASTPAQEGALESSEPAAGAVAGISSPPSQPPAVQAPAENA